MPVKSGCHYLTIQLKQKGAYIYLKLKKTLVSEFPTKVKGTSTNLHKARRHTRARCKD